MNRILHPCFPVLTQMEADVRGPVAQGQTIPGKVKVTAA